MTVEALATQWFVYIIHASDGSYYTGVTTDVQRRFKEHSEGVKGARYFRGRKPLAIVYQEPGHNRSSACQREAAIKKLKRDQKKLLVDTYPA
jgi:putative endonuclease